MLKRIKVRSKLLALVLAPLVALAVFAAWGAGERLDREQFFSREERLADLADAGADLTLAVHVERNRAQQIAAGGDADLDASVAATDTAVDRWLEAAGAARADLTGPVVEEIEAFSGRLATARAARDGRDMALVADQLLLVGRDVNSITIGLTAEAEDLELYRALSDYLQLARVQFGVAEITTIGVASIVDGGVEAADFALLRAADGAIDGGIGQFLEFAEPLYVERLEALVEGGLLPDPETSDPIVDLQLYVNRDDTAVATIEWLQAGETRLVSLNQVSSSLLESASASAAEAALTAGDEARSFVVLAMAVIITALLFALVLARSIAGPLRQLTLSAERLAAEELPALVESMRQGSPATAHTLTPIDTRGRDEVAQLATAISDIQDVTIEVAEEQGELLRRGISDMFVNLARRNQSLLDRQIDFIDQLEANEENPDTLENLFRLDHLATRMRRNAESLLVLAGAESSRRRGQAVEIVDVVRVAMGEIEDFSRIRMLNIAPATVAGSVAVDLAHLMSELMENASQFSPPDTPVEVVGQRTDDGTYQLTVTDRGIGLTAEQLIEANHTLSNPPVIGLELGRSLGFTVVSRLAHRLGISVRLASSAHGGVTAIVSIPAEMTGEISSNEPVAEAPDALHASGLAAASSEPIGLPDGTVAGRGLDLGVDNAVEPVAATESPVFDDDPLFDLAGRASSLTSQPASSTSGPEQPDAPDSRDMFDALGPSSTTSDSPGPTGDIFAPLEATPSDQTAAGLPRRTPRSRGKDTAEPGGPAGPDGAPTRGSSARPPQPEGPTAAADPSSLAPPPAPPTDSPPEPPPVPASAAPDPSEPPPVPASAAPPVPTASSPEPPPVPASTAPIEAPSTLGPPDPETATAEAEPALTGSAEVPRRPAATVAAVDASVTSAGLIRRTPRTPTNPPPTDGAAETAEHRARSPEEVRQMLSRYRTGLRRGRETPTS